MLHLSMGASALCLFGMFMLTDITFELKVWCLIKFTTTTTTVYVAFLQVLQNVIQLLAKIETVSYFVHCTFRSIYQMIFLFSIDVV